MNFNKKLYTPLSCNHDPPNFLNALQSVARLNSVFTCSERLGRSRLKQAPIFRVYTTSKNAKIGQNGDFPAKPRFPRFPARFSRRATHTSLGARKRVTPARFSDSLNSSMHDHGPQVFTGNANPALAQEIADYVGVPLGEATVNSFPDGETYVKINENIRGRDIFIVQPTSPPSNQNLMELLIMIDAARRASAQRITAVIPFYGYARQDRKDQPRVPITAKLVANLLVAAGATRVLTLDLHAQQIQGFFDIPVDHLYAAPVFYKYLAALNLTNAVVVSPDVGGIKLAEAYSQMLGAGLAIVAKQRTGATTVKSKYLIGDVKDKDVILVDDLSETAGTLTAAADLLKQNGARRIISAVSHAVLTDLGRKRLQEQSAIDELVTTNSTVTQEIPGFKLTTLSIAPLLGEAIKRIHDGESVSSLFNVNGKKK